MKRIKHMTLALSAFCCVASAQLPPRPSLFDTPILSLHRFYIKSKWHESSGKNNTFVHGHAAVGYRFQRHFAIETGALMISQQGDDDDEASNTFYGIDVALKGTLALGSHALVYAKVGPAMNIVQTCNGSNCSSQNLGASAVLVGGSTVMITPQLGLDADVGSDNFVNGPVPSTAFESDLGLSYHFH